MKIKKNGKVINLTESDIKKLSKKLLKEEHLFDNPLLGVIHDWAIWNDISFNQQDLEDCDCFNNIFK